MIKILDKEVRYLNMGSSVFLCLLFTLLYLGYTNFSRKNETFAWVNHTLGVINNLQRLETLVQEAGSNNRAFIITEQEQYRLRILSLRTESLDLVLMIGKETSDNPIQQKNVTRLHAISDQLIRMSDLAMSRIQDKRKNEVIEMVKLGKGQKIIQALTETISDMKKIEEKILKKRIALYDRAESRSAGFIFSASLFAFILLSVGSIFLNFQLKKRISIQRAIDRLTQIQKTILNSAAFALIATDNKGNINLFNPAAEKLLGYSESEMIGSTPAVFHDPSEIARMAGILTEELGKVVPVGFEVFTERVKLGIVESDHWTYIKKDRSRIPVKLTISALRDESGEINGYLGIAYDISRQIEFEAAMVEAKEAAQTANKAKSEFLANMSHEIRTPMNAIMGMAELLKDTSLDEDQRKYVEIFSRAGESLLNIINDILDLSKIEAGHFELDKSSFTLSSVVEKTVELMALRAHQKQLELVVDLNDDIPDHLVGDGNRLRQILLNLIGNAVKFTRRGEILLTVKQGTSAPGNVEIIFEIQDTGIGMTPEQLQKLFDRFAQADSSITKEFGGTGLGLSISKRLVDLMNGKIEVHSTYGIGTRFSVTISFEKDQSFSDEPMEMELKGDRVLVVDDSRTNRMILRKILEGREALVTETESGERAMELVKEHTERGIPFNLILLDCRMPGMDGFEVARRIKNNPSLQGPLLLMLTSDNRPGDLAKSRDVGFKSFLIKPVMKRELFLSIQRSILEKSDPQIFSREDEQKNLPERLSILLVDDNDENRLVIISFLKSYNWRIDEARNGRDALLMFQQNRYDMILMDMQMPVMDGYTATGEIRKLERERNEVRTPVIALTAYALKEEMEKSLQAGCDDHVTKPIAKATLLETVDRYTKAYSFKVDPDLKELIPDYIEKRRIELRECKSLSEKSDFPSLQKLGHKLRGSAGSYGFPVLSEVGKELEEGSRDSDDHRIRKALALYETVMARIKVRYS